MTPLPPVQPESGSIEEAIDRLTAVVNWARDSGSRIGYFAALYRQVTIRVREGIRNGEFDDNARMERFDVIFANRYLQALTALSTQTEPSRVWMFAFSSCETYWPIVLQHLLLGMNAHINLDLGIAAAEAMRGGDLENLHDDFDRINDVLASLVDDVQHKLARVWTVMSVFNRLLGSVDDALVQFSMTRARDQAWMTAKTFSGIPAAEWPAAIRAQDDRMMGIAQLVSNPGLLLSSVTHIVRLGEVQNPARVIDILK